MAARPVPRDPWGRPLVEPERLDRGERVELLAQAARALVAGRAPAPYAAAYLGRALLDWLADGGDLERRLGVRPERGSRRRPQAIIAQHERDRLVVAFAARVGTDRGAAAVLRGERACPPGLSDDLEELRAQHAPTSPSAIRKARRRAHRHRP